MRAQELRAEQGCHELAHRQQTRPHAIAHLGHQLDTGSDLLQFRELTLEIGAWSDTQLRGKIPVTLLDLRQDRCLLTRHRCRQQCLQQIGYSGERRMNNNRA